MIFHARRVLRAGQAAAGQGAPPPAGGQTPQWMMYVLIGLGGLTVLLLLIILGLLASLGSAVADIEDTNLLRDGIAATFDEGRMHAMLTAGAAFATKARNINWELDPDRDRELCHTGTVHTSCYPLGGQSQCNANAAGGCQWYDGYGCDGWYMASTQQCDIEIDDGTQDDIEELCEKAADAMARKTSQQAHTLLFR